MITRLIKNVLQFPIIMGANFLILNGNYNFQHTRRLRQSDGSDPGQPRLTMQPVSAESQPVQYANALVSAGIFSRIRGTAGILLTIASSGRSPFSNDVGR